MIKRLLLLFCCIMTGCNINCIEAGSGVSNSSIEIEVPAKIKNIDKSSPSSYWIDSGESISEKQTIKLTISGAISLCPKDSSNPKNVVVPAIFCKDGAIPEYSDDNDGTDPQKVCKNHGREFSSVGRYVDTGLNVNPGDILNFSLIPKKIVIEDCKKLPLGVVIDGPNVYYSDKEGKKSVSSTDVCKSGGSYYIKNEDGDISQQEIRFEPLQGREFDVLIGNGYTPYDNKAHHNRLGANLPWKAGALLDLRNIRPELKESYCNQPLDSTTKKFSSYDINCFCNKICYNDKAIWSLSMGPDANCMSSIRYKFKNHSKCSLKLEDFELDKETGFRTSWAELLVARISSSNSLDWNSTGKQCLPKMGQDKNCISYDSPFEKISLQLNHNYIVADNVSNNSYIVLGISDEKDSYHDNAGGYHVKVQRTCPLADGKKLYMYIGNSPPNIFPGENGTFHLFKESGFYTINQDNDTKKSGKIYFGVDIRGVKDEQFTDINQEFANANKYTVHLFRTKWNPNFSQLFITIRNAILHVLYDASMDNQTEDINRVINLSQGGAVRQIYNNYSTSKPFWNSVRALFVLYTMFSAIGYILGLIQLSKFDLAIRIAKMAFVVMIFSQNSWEIFSTHFFALFIQGVNQLIADFSGYLEADYSFAFLDATVGVLLAGDTWLRLLALFLAGPVGWLIFCLIIWGSISFFICILEAMLMYFMMIISTSFLLALSPLFLTFILFQRTKQLFDGWIKLLLNFSIQPIILFAALAFLNQVLLPVLHKITNFSACTKCVVEIKIGDGQEGEGICLFQTLLPVGFSNDLDFKERIREKEVREEDNNQGFFGLPFSLVTVLLYLIIANAMKGFSSIAESIALSISQTATNMMSRGVNAVGDASQALLSVVGLDNATRSLIKQVRKKSATDRTSVEFRNRNVSNRQEYSSTDIKKGSGLKEENEDSKLKKDDKSSINREHGQENDNIARNSSLEDLQNSDEEISSDSEEETDSEFEVRERSIPTSEPTSDKKDPESNDE